MGLKSTLIVEQVESHFFPDYYSCEYKSYHSLCVVVEGLLL